MVYLKTAAQCLLFVADDKTNLNLNESTTETKKSKYFILLPTVILNGLPLISKLFKSCGIKVFSRRDSSSFDVAETVHIVELILPKGNISQQLRVVVDKCNVELVQGLLGPNAVIKRNKRYSLAAHCVVDKSNSGIFKKILTAKVDMQLRNSMGGNLLHLAVLRKNITLLKILLKHVTYLHSQQKNGSTSLHLAVQSGRVGFVKLLLLKGANVNAKRKDGNTPLLLAVKKGLCKTVNLLLVNGADVNTQNISGESALQIAVNEGQAEIVECLLSHDPDPNRTCNKDILRKTILSKKKPCNKIVNVLLQKGVTLDKEDINNVVLYKEAIENNYLEAVRQLIQLGIDVNVRCKDDKGMSILPLTLAVKYGGHDVMKLLLDNRADVHNNDDWFVFEPLYVAVEKCDLKAVEILLIHDADPMDGILIPAFRHDNLDLIEMLLKHGANPNEGDPDAKRYPIPLVIAAKENNLEMINLFLKYGANINNTDGEGDNALLAASRNGCLAVIEYLIRNGAKLEERNMYDRTALSLIAGSGHFKAVDFLLKSGARYDRKNKRRYSPLHFAADGGFSDIFQMLLDHGFSNEQLLSNTGICELFQKSLAINRKGPFSFFFNNFHKSGWKVKQFGMLLACHMIKMKAAGLCYGENNVIPIWCSKESPSKEDYQASCEAEIAAMKSRKILNTDVSFYDILIVSTNRLMCFARNKDILEMFNAKNFEKDFPIYASIINCQLQKGIYRKELVEKGVETFCSICCKSVELPQDLVEKILNYLGNQDIMVFLNTISPKDLDDYE